MNPEFRRNVWLELSPRRLMTMTVVLVLAFFAAALSGNEWLPPATAVTLYYFIVVFWGSRNAALSVVGEIRDRTWDFQRSVCARRRRDDLGQAVRRDGLQLVWRRDLSRRHPGLSRGA